MTTLTILLLIALIFVGQFAYFAGNEAIRAGKRVSELEAELRLARAEKRVGK